MDGNEQSTQRVESLGEAPVWLEWAVLNALIWKGKRRRLVTSVDGSGFDVSPRARLTDAAYDEIADVLITAAERIRSSGSSRQHQVVERADWMSTPAEDGRISAVETWTHHEPPSGCST